MSTRVRESSSINIQGHAEESLGRKLATQLTLGNSVLGGGSLTPKPPIVGSSTSLMVDVF